MADFASAFAASMKAEGGYVNDPQDPGGETYKSDAITISFGLVLLVLKQIRC
jgi:lysozyme family protein